MPANNKFRRKLLLAGRVPANNLLLSGRVPANNLLLAGRVPANNLLLAGRVQANNFFLELMYFHLVPVIYSTAQFILFSLDKYI